jgi:hypothetical protein
VFRCGHRLLAPPSAAVECRFLGNGIEELDELCSSQKPAPLEWAFAGCFGLFVSRAHALDSRARTKYSHGSGLSRDT